jgi:formylglycine-generating enzyme required for sulfatase activity
MTSKSSGRVALLWGNSKYRECERVSNAQNDAIFVGAALERLGFSKIQVLDGTYGELLASVRDTLRTSKQIDTLVFFYSGHGIGTNSHDFLVPIDANMKWHDKPVVSNFELQTEFIEVGALLGRLRMAVTGDFLAFLDCCRDARLLRQLGAPTQEVESDPVAKGGNNTSQAFRLFATQRGEIAYDWINQHARHSPFTHALLRHLETPQLELRDLVSLVKHDVRHLTAHRTGGSQEPSDQDYPAEKFFFRQSFELGDQFREGGDMPLMTVIPPGRFNLGSEFGDALYENETPTKEVVIEQKFAVSTYPISTSEWRAFSGQAVEDPLDKAAVDISWNAANDYVSWLNKNSGHCKYRLLRESEWEYCCKIGEDILANYSARCIADGRPQLSRLTPNKLGLCGMLGNVWEWVADPYLGSYDEVDSQGRGPDVPDARYRVTRGGAWSTERLEMRPATRRPRDPNDADNETGLRVARDL